ncbi:MAG TPA: hypothetical protein VGM69_03005 [Chloroflexota bacterium]
MLTAEAPGDNAPRREPPTWDDPVPIQPVRRRFRRDLASSASRPMRPSNAGDVRRL